MPQQHQDPHGSSSAPQRDLSHHDPERKSPGYKARNNKGHHPPKGINTARNESQSKTHHKNTQHNQTRDNKSQPKNPHKKNPRHNTQPDTSHLVKARQAARPKVSYPEDLPVSARRTDIMQAIASHQVTVISGETGSGKTTQIPKMCIELGRGIHGLIGHTQPRRLAARSVATRIAHELHTELGQAIGFQVRFTDRVSDSTLVKLMTDGILLAEIQHDRMLRKYDTIIVDEAHERSLNIDFILGYMAWLLPRRPDLKLIVTSATIDADRFADHFQKHLGTDVPIIDVTGRTYPVEIRYRPLAGQVDTSLSAPSSTTNDTSPSSSPDLTEITPPSPATPTGIGYAWDWDVAEGICHACDELFLEGEGDILVFLPGERDIREADAALRDHFRTRVTAPDKPATHPHHIEILPLFARLSPADQNRIFASHKGRRIILATNIAETSLTVPGIKYVIDPGLARISRYSSRTKVQRLPIEEISQASAKQRSGRCGRIEAGIAIRLYDEDNFNARPEFTEPEILRTSLASVILSMTALKLGTVEDFPFIDPPSKRSIRDGVQLLEEIGALQQITPQQRGTHDLHNKQHQQSHGKQHQQPYSTPTQPDTSSDQTLTTRTDKTTSHQPTHNTYHSGALQKHKITKIGWQLSRLPIDPRLGRMLLEAQKLNCLDDVTVIVAALSMQDVRLRPPEHEKESDAAHRRFADRDSDFTTYLNLWRYVRTQSRMLSRKKFRTMCHREYLHHLRILEWQDVVTQLREMLKELNMRVGNLTQPTRAQIRDAHKDGDAPNMDVIRACIQLTNAPTSAPSESVTQALLAGLLSNLGQWDATAKLYRGTRGTTFSLWPGSGLTRKGSMHEWVMAAELVQTSKTFARNAASFDPLWAVKLGKHLVKRTYDGIYWSSSRGAAMVTERTHLYGLLLGTRDVPLASLGDRVFSSERPDPAVRHLLVDGDGIVLEGDTAPHHLLAGKALGKEAAEDYAQTNVSLLANGSRAALNATREQSDDACAATIHPEKIATRSGHPAAVSDDIRSHTADKTRLSKDNISTDTAGQAAYTAHNIARAMFIRHALVGRDWRATPGFQRRNEQTFARIEELEQRTRQAGLVADDDVFVEFFDERLGLDVVSATSFFAWWKKTRPQNVKLLDIPFDLALHQRDDTHQFLNYTSESPASHTPSTAEKQLAKIKDHIERQASADFPKTIKVNGEEIPLEYTFTPGETGDGITAILSLAQLQHVSMDRFTWLVPGMHDELVTEMIRALPKSIRRQLVPAPQVAKKIVAELRADKPSKPQQAQPAVDTGERSLEDSLAQLRQWAQSEGKLASGLRNNTALNTDARATSSTMPDTFGNSTDESENTTDTATKTTTASTLTDPSPSYRQLPFPQAFARAVHNLFNLEIPEDIARGTWRELPEHLRMRFSIQEGGRTLASSKNLSQLQVDFKKKLAAKAHSAAVVTAKNAQIFPADVMNKQFTHWPDSDNNPIELVQSQRQDNGIDVYPSLTVPDICISESHTDGPSVDKLPVRVAPIVHAHSYDQQIHQRLAVISLVANALQLPHKRIVTRLHTDERLRLTATAYRSVETLVSAAQWAAAAWLVDAFCADDKAWEFITRGPTPALNEHTLATGIAPAPTWNRVRSGHILTKQPLDRLIVLCRDSFEDLIHTILLRIVAALQVQSELQSALDNASPSLSETVADICAYSDYLLRPGFVATTPSAKIIDIPKFLQAQLRRLQRASRDPDPSRDLAMLDTVQDASELVEEKWVGLRGYPTPTTWQAATHSRHHEDELRRINAMVDDLRVSLFAQELGTQAKVSLLRIEAALEKMDSLV